MTATPKPNSPTDAMIEAGNIAAKGFFANSELAAIYTAMEQARAMQAAPEGDDAIGLLMAELAAARQAFKRIEQEPRTPTKMRDIAGARAHYAEVSLEAARSASAKVNKWVSAALSAPTCHSGIVAMDDEAEGDDALREALRPFADFAEANVDDDGWSEIGLSTKNERIVDWFGPSDFRNAALARADAPKVETK